MKGEGADASDAPPRQGPGDADGWTQAAPKLWRRLLRWTGFVALSEIAVAAILWAAKSIGSWPNVFLAVLIVALAVPIFVVGAWRAAIRRAHGIRVLQDGGLLRSWLGGRSLRIAVWIAVSFTMALVTTVAATGPNRPLGLALLVPPVLGFLFLLIDHGLRRDVREPHRRAFAISAAITLAPLLMVTADALLLVLTADIPRYTTLGDALQAHVPSEPARSAVVDEIVRLSGQVNAIEAFALGRVGGWGGGAMVVAWIGLAALNFALYGGLARLTALLLLPPTEWRRAILPATDAAMPRRLSTFEIGFASALAVILAFFILIPGLATLEARLQSKAPPSRYLTTAVEEIDGRYFRPGTIAILDRQRAETLQALTLDQSALVAAANAGFDGMEANVDRYLDAYYSLSAEYIRIIGLVTGEAALQERLAQDLGESLMKGDPFAEYEALLNAAVRSAEPVRRIYEAGLERVLAASQIAPPPGAHIKVLARVTADRLALPRPAAFLTPVETRAGGAAAIGAAAGGVVAAAVLKKVAAKGTLKLAAKAFAKVALSKAAGASGGAGVGAAVGGAIGSVVPGVGTAGGAIVGGALGGLLVGISVDALMLQLEEAWSREAFKRDLLAAIADQRAEVLALLAR